MSESMADYQLVDTRTNHFSVPTMITTFLTTGSALQKHAFFGKQENWPKWLEGATHYLDYADKMRVLDDAYRAGNRPMRDERDQLRDRAAFSYQLGGHYVTMRAYELRNPELLMGTFPLRVTWSKASATAAVLPFQVEIVLTGKSGPSGTAILKGHHVPKGGPYQLQLCKGAPASEDSWSTLPQHYPTCAKIVITNLDPVSQYFFRIRYNGPLGPGHWSQPVALIIH